MAAHRSIRRQTSQGQPVGGAGARPPLMSPGTVKRRSTSTGRSGRTELGRPLMKRLASYHQMAAQAAERGLLHVSSSSLAELLDIDDSLVRKDMGVAGISGRPKVGYDLAEILAR